MRGVLRSFRDADLRSYLRRCIAEGFVLEVTGDEHVRVTGPDGRHVKVSSTQYSGEATHRAIARIRRIGGPRRHG